MRKRAASGKPCRVNIRHGARTPGTHRRPGSCESWRAAEPPCEAADEPEALAPGAGRQHLLDPDEPEAGIARPIIELRPRRAAAAQVFRHGTLHSVDALRDQGSRRWFVNTVTVSYRLVNTISYWKILFRPRCGRPAPRWSG